MTATYPMPRPESDPRFDFGLMIDVAKVLEEHGYRDVLAKDKHMVDLQQALFRFLYAPCEPAVAQARQILHSVLEPAVVSAATSVVDPPFRPGGGSEVDRDRQAVSRIRVEYDEIAGGLILQCWQAPWCDGRDIPLGADDEWLPMVIAQAERHVREAHVTPVPAGEGDDQCRS